MTRRWLYLAVVAIIVSIGVLSSADAQAKYVDTKELTVKVKIQKYYTVHFDANGGSGTMSDQEFEYGVAGSLSENSYVREGYSFIGWNRVVDGGSHGDYYYDKGTVQDLTDVGAGTVTLYAQWEEDAMHKVAEMTGVCVFHGYDIQMNTGDGHITGDNCVLNGVDWADGTHKYIDTGVKLYDQVHYDNDYEIGFTIVSYDSNHQYKEPGDSASQATFMNTKYEEASRNWPGLVVRKGGNNITITQTINKKRIAKDVSATVMKIVVARVDGVVYYSTDDGPFVLLQDINGTADYFDTNVWFGASAKADGTPMRYIDATLSDLYIKIGERGANKHTISFDAGGVAADPSNITLIGSSKIGGQLPTMPSSVEVGGETLYFGGWYTGQDGAGDRITEDSTFTRDQTLYARWRNNNDICSADGAGYPLLQDCVDAISGQETEITLLDDIREQITISAGKEVVLDLNGFRIKDNNENHRPVIENEGKLTVKNGTITSAMEAAAINNNAGGELYVENGARIVATGDRQALYNDGGVATIKNGAYLSSVASVRAAVHNLNGGSLTIEGGTIISTGQEGVKNAGGTLVIGVEDGVADRGALTIQGATYGVTAGGYALSMFDGELRGRTAAIDDSNMITTTENNATAVGIDPEVTTMIDGKTYKMLYYESN